MSNSKKVHIALNVSDVNRSVAFYRAMFGADPVKRKPGYAKFSIDEPALESPRCGSRKQHAGTCRKKTPRGSRAGDSG